MRYKTLLLTGVVTICMVNPVQAKTVVDTYESNGIKIELSNKGEFQLSTSLEGGRLLYFTRTGDSQETLESEKYKSNVKFFDEKGNLTSERTDLEGKEMYSLSDYSNWIPLGYSIDFESIPVGSDYFKLSGQKVVPKLAKISNFNTWLPCNLSLKDISYFEVNCVYAYPNGTYSEPVTKTFIVDRANINSAMTPDLKVTFKEDALGSKVYNLAYSKGNAEADLLMLQVKHPSGKQDVLDLKESGVSTFTASKNGTYVFTLTCTDGKSTSVNVQVDGINYTLDGDTDKTVNPSDLQMTITGVPTSAKPGDVVTVHLHSNIVASIRYNGKMLGTQDVDLQVEDNGTYTLDLLDTNGVSYTYPLSINCFTDEEKLNQGSASDSTTYWSESKSTDKYDGDKLPQTGGLTYKLPLTLGVSSTILGALILLTSLVRKYKREGDE